MSANAPTFYAQQFATNVQLLLQQKGSKLRSAVTEGSYKGSQASPVDQIGSIEAQQVTSRFGSMNRIDASLDRRWVFPIDYDLPQLIDHFDKLRLIVDPESAYVTNAVYALGRKIDAAILTAVLATAKTGVAAATSTTFTAGNEVDVAVGGTNSRLNVQKLIALKELAEGYNNDLDNDPLFCVIPSKDHSSLLQEIQIISADFNGMDKPVLKDGRVDRFLGINFIHCELVETVCAGTSEVNVPAFFKSGMHLGIWEDVNGEVSKRSDLQGLPWQAYVKATFGATRIEENKVFNIESYR